MDIPNKLRDNVVQLRNFGAHGYILGQYAVYRNYGRQYTIDYCINTLKSLKEYLKGYDKNIYLNFNKDIQKKLIEKLISAKYKKVCQWSVECIQNIKLIDKERTQVVNKSFNNSFIDIQRFNQLTEDADYVKAMIIISIQGYDYKLVINNNPKEINMLNDFCAFYNYRIESQIDKGLEIFINLVKNE